MATIEYGYCGDDVNKLNKTFDVKGAMRGTFNSQFDIKSPLVFVHGVYSNYNYVHIPELKRYYFVDDVTIINSRYYELHLSEDVLYSYRDAIQKITFGGNVKRIDSTIKTPFKNQYNVIVTVEGDIGTHTDTTSKNGKGGK